MAQKPSPPPLSSKTQPLRTIRPTAQGVGISAEYVNDIIERIEDLVLIAQSQKPIAGNNVTVNYTPRGAVINVVLE